MWKSSQALCKGWEGALQATGGPDMLQQAEGGGRGWPAPVLRRCSLSVHLRNLPKKSGPDSSRETWLVGLHVCHLNSEEPLSAIWHLLQGNYESDGKRQAGGEGGASAGAAAWSPVTWDGAAQGGRGSWSPPAL